MSSVHDLSRKVDNFIFDQSVELHRKPYNDNKISGHKSSLELCILLKESFNPTVN